VSAASVLGGGVSNVSIPEFLTGMRAHMTVVLCFFGLIGLVLHLEKGEGVGEASFWFSL
jgi:hypothetical protein